MLNNEFNFSNSVEINRSKDNENLENISKQI
jgi:hypothetical protein